MKTYYWGILFCAWISNLITCYGQEQTIYNLMEDVRNAEPREWSEFPTKSKLRELSIQFASDYNKSEQTISLRQHDVKLEWRVALNGKDIGSLASDEKDMIIYLPVPAGTLRDGENQLLIKCLETVADDIRVGEIKIYARALSEVLSDASVDVEVFEGTTSNLLPARITIVNSNSSLQTVSSNESKQLAVRPGVVYTATGKAALNLPAGTYKMYVGRGFEYGIDSTNFVIKRGERLKKIFRIKKEVPTEGWVSSDTHIHTLTHSGHGDATIEERAITIAGEGIELPVATDHNIHVDFGPAANLTGVRDYFTPIVGDELTTKFGHFNLFETDITATPVDHNVKDWNDVTLKIQDTGNDKVIILNHARDVHNNFRPFGLGRHLSSAGISVGNWHVPANAMEVVNSGSQQSNFMNLYHDWFGMLNHGVFLTPVGSSDSHDVNRYIVGQGRTYIQVDDRDPGKIDIAAAIKNFRDGKVLVSLGLITKITVNNRYGPGELVAFANNLTVGIEVFGPAWTNADRVSLFANGIKIREASIQNSGAGSQKWKGSWDIPLPKHDIFLVAIAEGPGDIGPYWPIAKPYQPSSTDWTPRLIGSTGAVWIDADNNKRRDAAYEYAKTIIHSSKGDIYKTINLLTDYDAAVAAQVAGLLWQGKTDLNSHQVQEALEHAHQQTKDGFEKVMREINLLEK